MYHWFFSFSYISVSYIFHMAKVSHLASFPFRNFLLMFIRATHAALNLAPITHDHPLSSLTLSPVLHGHTVSYCFFSFCCGNKSGCCISSVTDSRMELINVRNSCWSPLQFLSKAEVLQNLADHKLMIKEAIIYLNNRLVCFTKLRTAFQLFSVHFQVYWELWYFWGN